MDNPWPVGQEYVELLTEIIRVNNSFYLFWEEIMRKQNKRKKIKEHKCPYCGAVTVKRMAGEIYTTQKYKKLYVCSRYPICDAYVSADLPHPVLADAKLRRLRIIAHRYVDTLISNGLMKKDDIYAWFAMVVQCSRQRAHISQFSDHQCQRVIQACKAKLTAKKITFDPEEGGCTHEDVRKPAATG